MRIGVAGLGAVGGLIAARFARAGHTVSALARGATLERVRARGLELRDGGGSATYRIAADDRPAALGAQDLVVVACKAPALGDLADAIATLAGDGAVVVPAMNGVPWWFLPSIRAGEAPLASVDPGGRILGRLPLERVLGCVVHLTCTSPEPGVVQHGFGERLIVGEPLGGDATPRVAAVVDALASAGFAAEASADVRRDVWYKLWGNMTMNPVSALTGAKTDAILDDPLVRAFMADAMGEAAAIGERLGCPIAQGAEERMALTRELGGFRTSMLQDALAARPLELDALVGAVRELGARVGVATPNIDALLGLARLMARERGLYPPA